jgi:hypothetical protein
MMAARARALEKPIPISDLRMTRDEAEQPPPHHSRNSHSEKLPQSGTVEPVPTGDMLARSRLVSAFVAQLLGQILPDPERANSGALAAYDAAPLPALMCDRTL